MLHQPGKDADVAQAVAVADNRLGDNNPTFQLSRYNNTNL